jgi:hypothetical protein
LHWVSPYIRSNWAASYVRSLLGRLKATVPAQVEVDVFADAGTFAALRRRGSPGSWVHIHHPKHAEELSSSRSTRAAEFEGRSDRSAGYAGPSSGEAWSDWIAAGLAGQAVRALHVVLDGAFDIDRPRLVMSAEPNLPARSKYAFVTDEDIVRLADAIGAPTLSFGSPPRNPADLATRMIADSVGQRRPGATIYSSISQDPDGDALAKAHAFLVDRSGYLPIPYDPSLFTFVQPEQIQSSLREAWPEPSNAPASAGRDPLPPPITLPGYEAHSDLENMYIAAPAVPTWVAASDRYLGNQWAGLAKSAESPGPTAKIKGAYDRGAAEALGELGSIVARHARPS